MQSFAEPSPISTSFLYDLNELQPHLSVVVSQQQQELQQQQQQAQGLLQAHQAKIRTYVEVQVVAGQVAAAAAVAAAADPGGSSS